DGSGVFQHVQTMGASSTQSVALGDVDGDGDPDALVGNLERSINFTLIATHTVWINNGQGLFSKDALITASRSAAGVALGDIDADGDLDALTSQSDAVKVHPNTIADNKGFYAALTKPGPTGDANFYATPFILSSTTIPFTFTLSNQNSEPSRVEGFYSVNGGGRWLPAVASGTITSNLSTSPAGQTYVYTWDTFATRFFGQADNTTFRLIAYPQQTSNGITGTFHYTNSIPGPYLWPYFGTQTFPFRARGTQVQVFSETVDISRTVENAVVFRLPGGQAAGGFLLADGSGAPYRTGPNGYLRGRGEIGRGDDLLALAPVHSALTYAGAPVFDGVDDYAVANPLHNAPLTETTLSLWMISTDTVGAGAPFSYADAANTNSLLVTDYNNFTLYRGDAFSVTTGISATDGLWHHLAVTWRGSDGQVKLYKDGQAAYTGTLAAGTVISPDGSLALGQNQSGGGYFSGALDEVRLWNRALTETEVAADRRQQLAGDEPGLVAYWPFDDPLSDGALDKTNNGNDLTFHGATWLGKFLGGYTVYHTNGDPTDTGLDAFTVSQPGVQVITVTARHPLILFDLDVSLEWDASNDPAYLQRLEFDLKRASQYLYDFSNGQIALGNITVHQDGDDWAYSHVVVQANNRLRPFAAIGGIAPRVISDTERAGILYGPGQVRIGSSWNRYGNPGESGSDDWPLILAHELGHLLLYLDDTYLGLDATGRLIAVGSCDGSAMGDVYQADNTEFVADQTAWQANCGQTLAEQTFGRNEWETIRLWYPWLISPTLSSANPGPSLMPYNLTTVTILDPITPTNALADPTFFLDYEGGVIGSSRARAFLIREGKYAVDLGNPFSGQNRILAYGAEPDNRLCIFDQPAHQYGCEVIEAGDNRLKLERNDAWTPFIQLTPVNSLTVVIQTNGVPAGLNLRARLYPQFGPGLTPITLTETTAGYSGTFSLPYVSMAGKVQLWAEEGTAPTEFNPRPEAMVSYAIGGNPGNSLGGGGNSLGGGGNSLGGGGNSLGGGGNSLGGGGNS
ncbi:MAG: LamG-like jellyroll fold domain-containing protein, partial [Anaerolineae bacterium]